MHASGVQKTVPFAKSTESRRSAKNIQGEKCMVKHHRNPVIQNHHISYNPEVKVQVFKGEHEILTLIQRRKRFSKGFLISLREEFKRIEQNAIDLSNPTFLKVKP